MVAAEFEYRHRFWMIVLVYGVAYAFYNLDHLNILYSIVPGNRGVVQKDMLVRLLYAAAAFLAAAGALLLTWASAYRPPGARTDRAAFSTAGPFRYVRNPQYLSYFLLILALGTFQSRLGFPVMLLSEALLLLRLIAREELLLAFQWGFVATLLAFAFTLSDPVGYAFAGATLSFLVLQRLVQPLLIRLRRT